MLAKLSPAPLVGGNRTGKKYAEQPFLTQPAKSEDAAEPGTVARGRGTPSTQPQPSLDNWCPVGVAVAALLLKIEKRMKQCRDDEALL